MTKNSIRIVCQNRRARHEYQIDDIFEAGIMLLGPEVKSLRDGRANLGDGYAAFHGGEPWLYNVHISPYPNASDAFHIDPIRPRKLLLHKAENRKLIGKLEERGYTLIPLKIYFKDGKAKVELGLAKGKRLYDKREAVKKRETERELRRRYNIR
ncbi:MAG: SsrA-binding protein SmpB [Dissulfurimicrobium sp.]|uniref:SsrA-binding protein SmpB n=1 Tax=Dissulfurimicrobium TaxID=1769732 RepID=UPI001EDAEA91|nr:SsrA-binding protein SmpB [Dissulfurimicrobium hydrothermale]UKL13970.1 SsrA-binding protein SmpB [Dissulfurimicrobium hydrothermale]